jgi:hypothetical protein
VIVAGYYKLSCVGGICEPDLVLREEPVGMVLLEEFPPRQICGFRYNVPRYLGLNNRLPERVLLGMLVEGTVDEWERKEVR